MLFLCFCIGWILVIGSGDSFLVVGLVIFVEEDWNFVVGEIGVDEFDLSCL